MSGEGGPLTRLTGLPGKHTTTVSPDERWIADVYSYTNQPPDLFVQENRPDAEPQAAHHVARARFRRHTRGWMCRSSLSPRATASRCRRACSSRPTFARAAPAWCSCTAPATCRTSTAGGRANYYREYMFDHLLMERGFIVIDVDYRGSAGYGRDWRTAIYEHMGGKDLDDITDAAGYLVAQHGANPERSACGAAAMAASSP